jgi:hypothetical protein
MIRASNFAARKVSRPGREAAWGAVSLPEKLVGAPCRPSGFLFSFLSPYTLVLTFPAVKLSGFTGPFGISRSPKAGPRKRESAFPWKGGGVPPGWLSAGSLGLALRRPGQEATTT